MSGWTRLHRVIDRLARSMCRHPEGTVCGHNAYSHDFNYRGYVSGFAAGTRHAEAEQRGKPPYDDHPCLRCGRRDCNDINAIITILAEPTGTEGDKA